MVVGLAAALAVASALPANAEPVDSDVTAEAWIDLEAFNLGFPVLVPVGPATLPVSVPAPDLGFRANGLTITTPDDCTRVVNSVTFGVTSSAVSPLSLQAGVLSRESVSAVPTSFSFAGSGSASSAGAGFIDVAIPSGAAAQSGVLTITLTDPLPAEDVVLAIGSRNSIGTTITFESATFSVTDDCPTPPVPPTPTAPAALAATGLEFGQSLGLGAALILLGGAAVVVALRRRAA